MFDMPAHSELVHIHIHLCDVGQANDVRNKADDCNEDLSTLSKDMGEFINQGSDEAFHSAELEILQNQVETITQYISVTIKTLLRFSI